jgi:hypothetical protein
VIENWRKRFVTWTEAEGDLTGVIYFRRAFAAIWLIYDLVDLSQSQILNNMVILGVQIDHHFLQGSQVTVICFELGMLIGLWPRLSAFGAFAARAAIAWRFQFNDYLYFCVITLILSQCDIKSRKIWPRDVLVLQTAWIYLASAILKLNPSFLSGGDLFVRQNYLATVLPLPYPDFYRALVANLHFDAGLAALTVFTEIALPTLLLAWWLFPWRRKMLRRIAILAAACMHLYAAYFLDVFFFGLSLVAQIFFLTWEGGLKNHRQS